MTFTISAVAQKGGAGKTTIALNIADILLTQKKRVAIFDTDPQGSARVWAEVASERGIDCPPVYGVSGASLRKSISAVAESFEYLIIDTAPRMTDVEAQVAISLSDLVLVPVSPGPQDVWALAQTSETIAHVSELTGRAPTARIVMNRIAKRTALSESIREGAGKSGLTVCETALGNRVAYPEAVGFGQGVCSYAPKSEAANEIRSLWEELKNGN